ncbi:hypothetical protein FRC01_004034 [Tulasnella sp. 417]|nr:hypothetical protein FRC01_004034 [Tulasnella sp. 417]
MQLGLTREGTRVWKFRDSLDVGLWNVFWNYARRVRSVEACNGLYAPEVIHDLTYQLERSSSGPSLLPNLRALSLRVLADDRHLIEGMPIITTRLRTLQMSTELNVSPSTVQRLIEHFTAIPLDQLTEIEFSRRGRINSDASLSLHRATFLQQNRSTLTYLNLSIFPLASEDLVQLGGFPIITRLTLVQKGMATELCTFFDVIASSFPHLRSIDITADDVIRSAVSIRVIESLAICRDLCSIYLSSHWWELLTGEDVRQFGTWWPLMEEFSLYETRPHSEYLVGTPLGILQDFAQAWSQTLRKVILRFDTQAPLPNPSSIQTKLNSLETLWVGSSPLREPDVKGVVEFLKALCQGPVNVVSFYGRGGNSGYRWRVVNEEVNATSTVQSDDQTTV